MDSDNEMRDEEAPVGIQLTKEFDNPNAQPCSIIELISLIKNDEKKGVKIFEDNSVIKLTKDYLNTFNNYGMTENIANKAYNIRRIFMSTEEDKFTGIEQTSLVDLAPSNADEAFSLIPTLKKKLTHEELQGYLDTLNKEVQI